MSDTSVFLWINHLSGHVRAIDEFFKGFSNDYFALIIAMLITIWLWFFTGDPAKRKVNQKTVMITMMSIGMAATAMVIINNHYFRLRPFIALPGQVNVVYYMPTDSSFPSNYAAIMFSMAFPLIIRYWRYGIWILAIAIVGSFGRIYMGVHYPLDILGGAGVGLLGCGVAYILHFIFGWLENLILWVLRFLSIA